MEELSGEGPLTVYVSAPLSGPRAADGSDVADGAKLALADAGGRAGGVQVRQRILDGAGSSGWDPIQVAGNARAATEDSSTIAYIGELESGATRIALPITNEAEIAHVSPGASAVDLTRATPLDNSAPERYRPSEKRTFARVIPDDDAAAEAAAGVAADAGSEKVAVSAADDGNFAQLAVTAFEAEARRLGLEVGRRAEAEFLAGEEQGMILNAGDAVSVSPALGPAGLPPSGQQFVERFRRRFGREPGPYAAYGYEAMALVLDAIRRGAENDQIREGVTTALLETLDRDSILGRYSITADGDTTLDRVGGYRLQGGELIFERVLRVP